MKITLHGALIDGSANQLFSLISQYGELMDVVIEWSEVTGYCPEIINITDNEDGDAVAEFTITEGDYDTDACEVVSKDYDCSLTKEQLEAWLASEYQSELMFGGR